MGKSVITAITVGVIAGIGVATGGFGLGLFAAWGTASAVTAGIAAASLTMAVTTKVPTSGSYTSAAELKQVTRSSAAAKRVIYGKTRVSGVLVFAEEQTGEQDDGEWIHLVLALSGHKIHAIGDIYFGDEHITAYSGYESHELINDPATANQFLLNKCPSWKSDMIGKGCALLRVSLKYDSDKYPSGLPNITVDVYGHEVFDPRDGATKYSNNAALVILDYYRSYLGVTDDELLMDYWISAANISDETVTNADGTTESRYCINGTFELSETRTAVLDDMLVACAGDPVFIGGKHGVMVGAYYGPATVDLFDYQIAGDISITPESSFSDRVNTITGKFIDPEQSYSETDFPSVSVAAYIDEDGGEITEDVTYRFVTSEWQAQRLANIKLQLKRYGREMTIPMNLSGYKYRPGLYVNLHISSLGIDNTTFRVRKWDFSVSNGITLTLRQEPAEVYGDAIGKQLIRSDLTSLPTGGVPAPENLMFSTQRVGDVVQGELTWTNTGTVAYNIVIIKDASAKTVLTAQAPSQSCVVSGLPVGNYSATVQAVSVIGKPSALAGVNFTIAVPPMPSSVAVRAENWSIELRPGFTSPVSFGTLCEFFFSTIALPIADVESKATSLGMAAYLLHTGLQPDTTYHYWVRSVNSYGKSGLLSVSGTTTYDAASILAVLDGQIGGEHLRDELKRSIDNITTISDAVEQITVDLSTLDARDSEAAALLNAAQNSLGQNYIDTNLLYAQINQQVLAYKTQVDNITNAILSVDPATGQVTIEAVNVAKADLETKITAVQQQVDGVAGTLSQKASQVVVDDVSSRLSTAETKIDAINTEITNQVTRAEFDDASSNVTQLTNRMDAAEGVISTLATEQTIDDLGTRVATVEQNINVINTDISATAQTITGISSAVGDNESAITALQKTVTDANSATAQSLTNLQSSIDDLSSSITELDQVVNDGAGSLASKFESISASADLAAIAAMSSALSSAEQDQTSRKSEAVIKRDQTAIANNQESMAKTLEELSAEFDAVSADMSSRIITEETARANAVQAVATSVKTLESDYKSANRELSSSLANSIKTLADSDEALSNQLTKLTATTANNAAAIQNETNARVNADSALAENIQIVQANVDDVVTSVQTVSKAQEDTDGNLTALWATKAQVGGAAAGFGLEVSMNTDGSVLSSFLIDADVFSVLSRASGATSKIHPFTVKNGTVYINHALIDSAEIDSLISDYINATNLHGTTITGVTMTIGEDDYVCHLENGAIGVGKGGTYSAFGSNWHTFISNAGKLSTDNILATGGEINHLSVKNCTISDDCDVRGTVYANKIVGDVLQVGKFYFPATDYGQEAAASNTKYTILTVNVSDVQRTKTLLFDEIDVYMYNCDCYLYVSCYNSSGGLIDEDTVFSSSSYVGTVNDGGSIIFKSGGKTLYLSATIPAGTAKIKLRVMRTTTTGVNNLTISSTGAAGTRLTLFQRDSGLSVFAGDA